MDSPAAQGQKLLQDPAQGKAPTGVQVQTDPVQNLPGRALALRQIGAGQGAFRNAAEGEQSRFSQLLQNMRGFLPGEFRRNVQRKPQGGHQPVGRGGVLPSGSVVVQHDPGDGDMGAEFFQLMFHADGGFRGTAVNAVKVENPVYRYGDGRTLGQLVHKQAVLSVGEFRIPEGKLLLKKEFPPKQTAPYHRVRSRDVNGKLLPAGLLRLCGSKGVGELIAAQQDPVTGRLPGRRPKSAQNAGQDEIVGIHKPEKRPSGGLHSPVPGGGYAAVGLVYQDKVGIPGAKGFQNAPAAVGGAIIDADDLVFLRRDILVQQRIQAFVQVGFGVVYRNYKAQKHDGHSPVSKNGAPASEK